MKEIEVKARLSNPKDAIAKLRSLGCELGVPVVQLDTIFVKPGIEFNNAPKGTNWLRIRVTDGGKATLNLKRSHENELVSTQFETAVSDPEQTAQILEMLGYFPAIAVKKTRRMGKLGDLEICVDEVEDLGAFIEVEKLAQDTTAGEKVQQELFEILKKLGIQAAERVDKGYDTLMYNKLHSNHDHLG